MLLNRHFTDYKYLCNYMSTYSNPNQTVEIKILKNEKLCWHVVAKLLIVSRMSEVDHRYKVEIRYKVFKASTEWHPFTFIYWTHRDDFLFLIFFLIFRWNLKKESRVHWGWHEGNKLVREFSFLGELKWFSLIT